MNRMTYATACYTALLWQPPAPLRILKYGLAVQKKEELKKKRKKKRPVLLWPSNDFQWE